MTTILRYLLFILLTPAFAIVAQAVGTVQDDFPVTDADILIESMVQEIVDGGSYNYDSSGALLHQRRSVDGKAADDDGLREYGESDRFGAAQSPFSFSAEFVAANNAPKWIWGHHKPPSKWFKQMEQRGWTPQQITEAMQKGTKDTAPNLVNKGHTATRYSHPETGRYVVVDDVTQEIIQVGGDGFTPKN